MILGYLFTGLVLAFAIIFEIAFINVYNTTEREYIPFRRLQIYFGVYFIYMIFALFLDIIFGLSELRTSYYIALIILLYSLITEHVFYSPIEIEINQHKKNKNITILIILILILLSLIIYSWVENGSITAVIFSKAEWFSITILAIINDPQVYGLLTLLFIGGLVNLLGNSQGSRATRAVGNVLLYVIPVLYIFSLFLRGGDEIEVLAPQLLSAFENEGLAIVIYTIIELAFFTLIVGIIKTLVNLIEPPRFI